MTMVLRAATLPERANPRTPARGVLVNVLVAIGTLLFLRDEASAQQEVRVELAKTPASFTFTSPDDFDFMTDSQAGGNTHTVGVGDVNGDGLSDLVMAAAIAPSANYEGRVFVVLGALGCSIPPSQDLAIDSDVTIEGPAWSSLGSSVSVADFDGDGFDDIVMGAPLGSQLLDPSVYVVFGAATLPATIPVASPPAGVRTLRAKHDSGPAGQPSKLGSSVATGDIDADGLADIIAGDPEWQSQGRVESGEVYVIWGTSTPPAGIDVEMPGTTHLKVFGPASGSRMGYAVHAGQVDSGPLDVVMNDLDGRRALVLYGGASLSTLTTIDMANAPDAQSSVVVENPPSAERVPVADIASSDMDGDGSTDLAFSSTDSNSTLSRTGRVWVVRGPVNPNATVNLPTAGVTTELVGIDGGDCAGFALGADDLDLDGSGDLLVGAQCADSLYPGTPYIGEVYVVFGKPGFFNAASRSLGETDPAVTRIATIFGAEERLSLGSAALAADLDGEGYPDLIIGASDAAGLGRQYAGETYVLLVSVLARNAQITTLGPPPSPALSTIFPLDFSNPPPIGDRYRTGFVSGAEDPEAGILTDFSHPLVFYQVPSSCNTLRMVKSTTGAVPATVRIIF